MIVNAPSARVRLIGLDGSPSAGAGRVEVYHYGQWGSVCDDGWNDKASSVVCRHLGHSSGVAVSYGGYGQSQGPIWLDDVVCAGNETQLTDCLHSGWATHNCHHAEDAALVCCGRGEYPM